MATSTDDKLPTVACCPDLAPDGVCDELDFFYRLTSWTTVAGRPGTVAPAPIPVEVKLHFHLKRCRGPLALGDLYGPTNMLEVLFNLQTVYGDPRYRPSPWLRRRGAIGLSLLHEEA